MIEIWKPVPGYEALYHVSNLGRVKSVGRRSGRAGSERILIPYNGKYGHGRVQLCSGGKKSRALVHRLVATAFVSGGSPEQEVNHIDFDPTNNRADNLEWVTHRENILHSRHRLARKTGNDHGMAKLTAADVLRLRARYAEGGISFVKLGLEFGICGQQCHRIVRGLRWADT